MTLYIAGPMRGIPEYNFPEFNRVAEILRRIGHEVFNPAERDVKEDGFNPKTDEAKSLKHYMQFDLRDVCKSDGVVVLDKWETSQGACLEVHVASEVGVPVYRLLPFDGRHVLERFDPKQAGRKFDGEKLKWSRMLWSEIEDVMKVVQYGAQKYDWGNWQKVTVEQYKDALIRHVLAEYIKGETHDLETGLDHLAHAVCNALFLMWFRKHKDDKGE